MEMRARLLKGATSLLYFGPLLAGLGGFGWTMVPSFVAIFVLWQMIVRPHNWPTSLAELGKSELWVGVAAQVAVQALLVVVCFGIGRGLGGAVGTLPLYDPALPLSVSFLSIPICRLLWNPWKGDSFELLSEANEPNQAQEAPSSQMLADRLLQPLQDMNGRISTSDALRHLGAMAEHVDHAALRDALIARVVNGNASEAIRTVLVVQTTDPVLMDLLDEGSLTQVLHVLPEDEALIDLFTTRVRAAIAADGDLVACLPADLALNAAAKRLGEEWSDALRSLSALRLPLTAA
jgi:hypothetical protein